MLEKSKALSAKTIAKLSAPGLYAAGGAVGLYLRVAATPGRSKSWVLRVQVSGSGQRRDVGLGGFPLVGLAEARERAMEFRKIARSGVDPVEQRRQERGRSASSKIVTFERCAAEYRRNHQAGWRSAKTGRDWWTTLQGYAFPQIGTMPVATVDVAALRRVLEPIWANRPVLAGRVRARIEAVLDFAKTNEWCAGENPARLKGHLENILPKIRAKVEHHAAMPYAEIPGFMSKLRAETSIPARALEFTVLTGARSGEVRRMTWDEIDLEARIWTVPAERMKAHRPHRVPLTDRALEIVRGMAAIKFSPFVFGGAQGGAIYAMALIDILKKRLDRDGVTVHGFRSTFSDWAAECTEVAREVVEAALAHQTGDVTERSYRRGDALEKRAQLMRAWCAYCGQEPAEIVPLRA
jgi:integrase